MTTLMIPAFASIVLIFNSEWQAAVKMFNIKQICQLFSCFLKFYLAKGGTSSTSTTTTQRILYLRRCR